jgi:hypothetical protein
MSIESRMPVFTSWFLSSLVHDSQSMGLHIPKNWKAQTACVWQ